MVISKKSNPSSSRSRRSPARSAANFQALVGPLAARLGLAFFLAAGLATHLSYAMPRSPAGALAPALSDAADPASSPSASSEKLPGNAPSGKDAVLAAVKKAARFLMETVSNRGGFLSTYASDFSEQWGEIPARKSQAWVQSPGTVSMGELMLRAAGATGDPEYLRMAEKIAERPRLRPASGGGLALFHRFRPAGHTGILRTGGLQVLGMGGVLPLRR